MLSVKVGRHSMVWYVWDSIPPSEMNLFGLFSLFHCFSNLWVETQLGNMLKDSHLKFWVGTQECSFASLSHPRRFWCKWFITKLWQTMKCREDCVSDLSKIPLNALCIKRNIWLIRPQVIPSFLLFSPNIKLEP